MPLDPRFNFQAQDIDAFWGQSVAMQPMFAAEGSLMGNVRVTQSRGALQFSQTLTQSVGDVGGRAGNEYPGAYLVSSFLPEAAAATTQEGALGPAQPATIRPALLFAERGSQASLGLTSLGVTSNAVGAGTAWSLLRNSQGGDGAAEFFAEQNSVRKEAQLARLLKLKNERRSQVQMFRK